MSIPQWAKPIFIFFTIIFSVVFITALFFVFTALQTTNQTDEKPLAVVQPSATPAATTQPQQVLGKTSYALSTSKLYLLINAHRENFNLPKLQPNAQLEASAHLKLQDMIEKEYYQHQDNDQQTTWHFIQVAGYQYRKAGENLAFNMGSEWDIFQAWVKSQVHNQQMLEATYTDMGIAVDCDSIDDPKYKCIVVAHFGRK